MGLRPRFLMLAVPLVIAFCTRFVGWPHKCMVGTSFVVLRVFSLMSLAFQAVFP